MGLPGTPGLKGPIGPKVIIYACLKSHLQLFQTAVLVMQRYCTMKFETMADFHLSSRNK